MTYSYEIMTTAYNMDIVIPSDYQPHPEHDPVLRLVEEIKTYPIPDHYDTVEYVTTKAVNVNSVQKPGEINSGRFRGVTKTSYETVDREMSKGWKFGSRPAAMLEGEDWLINGNHRLRWYKENGYQWMPVDVFRLNDGYEAGDACDEVGLLYQPQPEGTASSFEDYKQRGILFVERRKNEGILISQELVNAWVDRYAANEKVRTRSNLKTAIFNNTGKSAWLISATRSDMIDLLVLKKGWVVRDAAYNLVFANGEEKVVDRLFEASQKVFLRDFLPLFFRDASEGIKTRLHFYVTTTNIKDGNALLKVIKTRINELYGVINSLEKFDSTNRRFRDYLEVSYRYPQVHKVDGTDLVKII